MVRHRPLEAGILVRIQVRQLVKLKSREHQVGIHGFSVGQAYSKESKSGLAI